MTERRFDSPTGVIICLSFFLCLQFRIRKIWTFIGLSRTDAIHFAYPDFIPVGSIKVAVVTPYTDVNDRCARFCTLGCVKREEVLSMMDVAWYVHRSAKAENHVRIRTRDSPSILKRTRAVFVSEFLENCVHLGLDLLDCQHGYSTCDPLLP